MRHHDWMDALFASPGFWFGAAIVLSAISIAMDYRELHDGSQKLWKTLIIVPFILGILWLAQFTQSYM